MGGRGLQTLVAVVPPLEDGASIRLPQQRLGAREIGQLERPRHVERVLLPVADLERAVKTCRAKQRACLEVGRVEIRAGVHHHRLPGARELEGELVVVRMRTEAADAHVAAAYDRGLAARVIRG